MSLFDKLYVYISLTELQLFALFSWANEWVFNYPIFYPFVLIITLYCSTEGKDMLILRPLPSKCSAMEKHFLREPPAFLRMVAKGARPLWVLLAVLPTFLLHARSWLKNNSFTSMSDWSQVCHILRLAVAREQLRRPVAICFFFLEDFHATQGTSIPQINSIYAKRILENSGNNFYRLWHWGVLRCQKDQFTRVRGRRLNPPIPVITGIKLSKNKVHMCKPL